MSSADKTDIRTTVTVVLLMLAILACGREEKLSPPVQEDRASSISAARKAEIRRFWETYRRATALRVQGDWAAAVPIYRETLEIDPDHEDGLYYLGNGLFELGRYDEAAAAWERLVKVNLRSSRAHIQLGMLHACGAAGAPFDLDRARREFERAMAVNKEESGPVVRLGEVALLQGDEERAFEYLSTASRQNFRSVEAHYLLGYLHWKSGDLAAAEAALRRAVEMGRGKQVSASASGEGDTKEGKPLLVVGTRPKSILELFWRGLGERKEDGMRVEEEYRRLAEKLREL